MIPFKLRSESGSFCEVGVPQFTAPELQERPFRGLRRSPDHDAFGLALLCFHLLFMGRHPFAGRYRGKGDMPIERAIRDYRFAFGQHAAAQWMEPPPHTLPFSALPRPVADLFERAFVPLMPGQRRPTPREWLPALERLNREFRSCGRNAMHKYPRFVVSLSVVRLGTGQRYSILRGVAVGCGQPGCQSSRF